MIAKNESEFAQNDQLREAGRVDHFGRADYREKSDTYMWLMTQVRKIADRIVDESESTLNRRVGAPPRHLHRDEVSDPVMPAQSEMALGLPNAAGPRREG